MLKHLPSLLTPEMGIPTFRELDVDLLKKKGIQLLICDIDNTLVAHDVPKANEEVKAFVKKVQEAHIIFVLMSNNTKERVQEFGESVLIEDVYSFACKPFPFSFQKVCKKYGLSSNQVAILGDQLFTDILGGNLLGMMTILSHPISEKDRFDTKLLRKLERFMGRQNNTGRPTEDQ